jgi:hypothetical protein
MPTIMTLVEGAIVPVNYPTTVHYEWWIEEVEGEYEDSIDCYEGSCQAAQEAAGKDNFRGCLRRHSGNEAEGILDTGYAYIIDGVLDAEFCSGHKVPKRFLAKIEALTHEQFLKDHFEIRIVK